MTIIRATNSHTGEIWELNSGFYNQLNHGCNQVKLLNAIRIFNEIFSGSGCTFDKLEVIAE